MKLPQNNLYELYEFIWNYQKSQINMYSTTTNQLAKPPNSLAQVLSPGVQRDPRGPHAESWAPRGR